ncbi:MAG: amidohydrolase family protein [Armatimonadota bacterium]
MSTRGNGEKLRAAGLCGGLLALACALCGPGRAQDAAPLLVKAAEIIPVAGDPIAPGEVLVRNGKIAAVGSNVEAPGNATVIEAGEGVVIPGLVAALTTLAEPGRDTRESVTPELRMADGLDLYGDWRSVLSGGVTTVYLSPPSRRLMPGRGAVAKLSDGAPSARLLKDPAALRIVLGQWPKHPPLIWKPPLPPTAETPSVPPERQLPTTRMGEMMLLRRVLEQARSAAGAGDDRAGPRAEALAAALRGDAFVRARADRAEDIRNALALAEEFGLRLVIEGGREAYELAGELSHAGVPVVLTLPERPGRRVTEDLSYTHVSGQARADNAAVLIEAGVKVAIATSDDSIRDLLAVAASTVGNGAPAEAALRAVTLDAAEILGVEASVGTIEVGKDADLVVLTGAPFETRTVVQMAISDGRVVYERKAPQERAGAPAEPPLILRARQVVTGTGGIITDGEVRIRGAVIESVGKAGEVPEGAEVIELGDRVIMPGMVDMQSHLGLHWESEEATLNPQSATTGPPSGGAKHVSIADAVDPTDPAFREALRAGVTSIVLAPGDTGLFCGTVSVLKTAGASIEQRIVEPIAALKFSMLADRDKLARVWQARDLLEKAKKYDSDWAEFDRRWTEFERRDVVGDDPDLKEPQRPRRDGESETLRALFREKVPALVVANRPDEIRNAVKVFCEEYGLDLLVLGASEGDRLASELRAAGVAAAIGPEIIREERGREVNPAAVLARVGVPVAFQSQGTSATQFLRITAAHAVRPGMAATDALRAVTVRPAQLLGLDHRIGCLEAGRDADLVVLSGDPLELTSRVEKVFVNGVLAYDAEIEE